MSMEHEKSKDVLTGAVEAKRTTSSIEDKHFGLINEKGDHNVNCDSAVHNATKALLANESGAQTGSFPEPRSHPSALKNPQTIENNEDGSSTQKRTESPDSEIVVIDDLDERQSIGSGLDSDIEDNISDVGEPLSASNVKQYDPSIDDKLPDTVTLLTTPDGGKVYLVGTAHFSLESQNDVSKIIQAVQPHIVVVELCKSRVHILQLDEQTILEEAQNLSFQKVLDTIQQNGLYNGLMYLLLLTVSARLTKELGMAPGGEFRTAFAEVKKIPNCLIHMGDRSISITIQRALSFLSWRQTLKLVWHLLTSRDCITKEDIERCKRRDLLEETLAEMTGEFPALGEVFVKERDIYLTHSLQLACLPQRTPNGLTPTRVVGVVGIGHAPGIVQYWGKVKPSEIAPILRIPPPSLSSKILRLTIKASLVGAVIYVGYKIIPLPSGVTFQSVKSSVEGLLKVSATR
ncbi:traB domain-containing protein [Cephus cinctus]|uniref:TraB domain-containing protein n=1 Tax=Cephus cinctus TaxID=211228 RepID=A0AAJ7BQT2_CEPCN|nr:traB domain-containing protein [Cephus cinctus]